MKLTLGITGGMGSGKSYVSSIFEEHSIPVYNSDNMVKHLLNTNEDLKSEVIKHFGEDCYVAGKWNRDNVVKMATENSNLIDEMGVVIEPYLSKDFLEFVESQTASIVAVESAILYKSSLWNKIDLKLTVDAPLEVRLNRIRERDPFRSENEIKMLLDKQKQYVIPFCEIDFTIDNDGIKNVREQVQVIIGRLVEQVFIKIP